MKMIEKDSHMIFARAPLRCLLLGKYCKASHCCLRYEMVIALRRKAYSLKLMMAEL